MINSEAIIMRKILHYYKIKCLTALKGVMHTGASLVEVTHQGSISLYLTCGTGSASSPVEIPPPWKCLTCGGALSVNVLHLRQCLTSRNASPLELSYQQKFLTCGTRRSGLPVEVPRFWGSASLPS